MMKWGADKKLPLEWEELKKDLINEDPLKVDTIVEKLKVLEQSKDLEKLVLLRDGEGISLLMYALRNNAPSEIIDYLYEADEKLKTDWEDLRDSMNLDQIDEYSTVDKLQAHRETRELEQLVLMKDREGHSLLSHALRNNAPSMVIDYLFAADKKLIVEWEELRELFKTKPKHDDTIQRLNDLRRRKVLEQLVLITYQGNTSLLSCALKNHVSSAVINILIQADERRDSIYARDGDFKRPIHHALVAKSSKKNLQLLLEADVKKKTLSKKVLTDILNDLPKYVTQDWMNLHLAKPLLTHILEVDKSSKSDSKEGEPESVRKTDSSESDRRAFQNTDSMKTDPQTKRESIIGDPGSIPVDYYPMLAASVCKSKDLQELVNRNSVERHVVFVMLADFYANCALIVLFLRASDVFVTDSSSESSIVGLYVIVGYFLLRQILTISAQKFQYLYDWWNFHDVCRMFLVLAAAVGMQRNDVVTDNEIQTLLLWTGAFVFIGMVSFLRSTFLPFSRFVSGVLNIFRVLMPFFVVSGFVLVAFAYLYFINEYEDPCLCEGEEGCACEDFGTLKDAFLTVYTYFVGGPENTENVLDIVFGLVIVIIFLNVVIAIVSEAWEEAAAQGAHAFWLYRLGFLAELWPLEQFGKNHRSPRVVDLGNWVDSLGDYRVFKRLDFGEDPSKYILEEQDDEEPYGSCRTDLDGVSKKKLEKAKSFHTEWKEAKSNSTRRMILCHFVWWIVVFGVCIMLGIVTFGLLWPKRVRMFVFGRNKTRSADESGETEQLKVEIKNLKSDVHEVKREILDILHKDLGARTTARS